MLGLWQSLCKKKNYAVYISIYIYINCLPANISYITIIKGFGFSPPPGHTLRSCRRAPGATAAAAATLHRASRVFGDVRAGAAGVVLENRQGHRGEFLPSNN